MEINFHYILDQFLDISEFKATPLGNGHINDTYLISSQQNSYVLQCLNSKVFPSPEKIMENLTWISSFYKRRFPGKSFLTPIKSKNGQTFAYDDEKHLWRMFNYIKNTVTVEVVETEEQAYEAGRAFGEFQNQFAEYNGPELHETIKDFHNTKWRYKNFEAASLEGDQDRIQKASKEIEWFRKHKDISNKLLDLYEEGLIPERITHNDCKINNLLLDRNNGSSVCVIDLDTVMPGLSLYDLGDLLRTITSPCPEDEEDLSKIHMRKNMCREVIRGYLSEADFLNQYELENVPFSGILLTYENGMRFLTDYLLGDNYFKVHKEDHNLIRARSQIKLAESMLEAEREMQKYVYSITGINEAVR